MLLMQFRTIVIVYVPVFPGCLPNIARNAIVNCSELVTYDVIKELILKNNLMTGESKFFK